MFKKSGFFTLGLCHKQPNLIRSQGLWLWGEIMSIINKLKFMIRLQKQLGLLALFCIFTLGCGAVASLPPQEAESLNLINRTTDAVWYAENGTQEHFASPGDSISAEDGQIHASSILVIPPSNESTYVHGAFSLQIPDQDQVILQAQVGVPSGFSETVVFRVYVQDQTQFPKLAEVTARADGKLDSLSVNLSSYRGKDILLILAIASPKGGSLTSPGLWVNPQILNPSKL